MKKSKVLPSHQAYSKIKDSIQWYTKKLGKGYDKPRKRFISEIINGMLRGGESILSRIACELRGSKGSFHSKEKRLSYQINKNNWDIDRLRQNHLETIGERFIDADTIIGMDITDVNKNNGKVFEYMTKVHDGSSGEIVNGYWTLVIEAIKSKGRHLPLYM